jgi:hypothetical protein
MQKPFSTLLFLTAFAGCLSAQKPTPAADAEVIRGFYNQALTRQQGYQWLRQLTQIGPRFAGTPQADSAVFYFKAVCDSLGLQTQLQPVQVPVWQRGPQETAAYSLGSTGSTTALKITALGGSVPTPPEGLKGEVVEITNFNQLDSVDLKGKIAFFNIPMDPTYIATFFAYGNAVKQRWAGAVEASKRGAIGVVIRSLSSSVNDYPHTGSMTYAGAPYKIPAGALSTLGAEQLSGALKKAKQPVYLRYSIQSAWRDSVTSYNLIADFRGSEKPDEYILVGGHLDSWDLGTGAHDDGAGSMHALESIYLLQQQKITPKRTVRLVLFMNEEFGLGGAKAYARQAAQEGIDHVIAIESDGGGFSPRGISMVAPDSTVAQIRALRKWLEPYGIYQFATGGAGADINQLKEEEIVLIGLRPDSHRYFEVHHSERDVFENVNARELEMGSATLASLIYLLDRYNVGSAGLGQR